jgi:hypothetical protein
MKSIFSFTYHDEICFFDLNDFGFSLYESHSSVLVVPIALADFFSCLYHHFY